MESTEICLKCLESLESAGQLEKSTPTATVPYTNCEQCGSPLVDGETFFALVEF